MLPTLHTTTLLREALSRFTSDHVLSRLDEQDRQSLQGLLSEAVRAAQALERMVQSSLEVMLMIGSDGQIISVNQACASVLACDLETLNGKSFADVVHPDDRPSAIAALETVRQGTPVQGLQIRCAQLKSPPIWMEWNMTRMPEDLTVYAVGRDISKHKQYERLLEESEHLYESLFATSPDAVYAIAANRRFTKVNPSCERISGWSAEQLLKMEFTKLIPPDVREMTRANFEKSLLGEPAMFDTAILHKTGRRIELNVMSVPIVEDGKVVGVYGIARDVTDRKLAEEQLAHLAYHDSLTGLANRSLFMTRLEQALARSDRNQPALGILYMDLDDFKVVNDSLGHRAGDALLIEASRRLQACVGPLDTVARLGGDEFVVLIAHTNDTDDAIRVADTILKKLSAPFFIDGRKMVVTPSVGVVMGNQGSDAKELLRHADIAMYQAKLRGKARYEAFTPVMYSHALQRLDLETALRRAVERDEFRVYYQPVIDLKTGLITGAEALVRWEDPHRGLISPAQFIPLAEETGLIMPIGKWVLKEACRQAKEWHKLFPGMTVSVNLSVKQFNEPFLADDVAAVLTETGLDPGKLQLEITETVLMRDADSTHDTLRGLKALGIGLSMDDFGTGYSSLSYLKRFPIDILKVDRSFVMGLGQSQEDNALVQTVIWLAEALHLTVTAEGVETEEQMNLLKVMGCQHGQGYHFAKPLTNDAMSELLASQRQW